MRLLDISFRWPEENLAFDEMLLDAAETGKGGETLRFWESRTRFVCLGVAQHWRREVYDLNCLEDRVPILRRASGGGCVLQGPGCLNYTLVLGHEFRIGIETIRGSYCYILGRIAAALREKGLPVRHKGISDLAMGGKKVSGNSQKRRKRFILHHGTLLYDLDMDRMERYLREPETRPQYRGTRTHRGFVRSLPLDARALREVVCEAFEIDYRPVEPERGEIRAAKILARDKYAHPEWTYRR